LLYSEPTQRAAAHLIAPAHPGPETLTVATPDGAIVQVTDDPFSDRVRCDHPAASSPEALATELLALAADRGRGRVIALVPAPMSSAMERVGFEVEGVMPGFYAGQQDCAVLGAALTDARRELSNPIEVARVDALIESAPTGRDRESTETVRATLEHAPAIAELIAETFDDYPTPSHDPAYIARQIEEGTPFRLTLDEGQLVACASADLVRMARTAELTDCATRPDHRGRGYMQSILADLIDDVRDLDYPTVFTRARARIAGVNLAFQRLGFTHRGRMIQSCRIGDGLEDMNIWSLDLREHVGAA
jgi:putative beta-lysine N-acetyltransferase